jgi:transcriptional regulator with XRE-family HTH domain
MTEAHRTPTQTVAAAVREIRETRLMSQSDLAKRMVQRGHRWTDSSVSRVEGGKRDITVDELVALGLALGIGPQGLLAPQTPGVAVGGGVVIENWVFTEWLQGRLSLFQDADGKSFLTKLDESLKPLIAERQRLQEFLKEEE